MTKAETILPMLQEAALGWLRFLEYSERAEAAIAGGKLSERERVAIGVCVNETITAFLPGETPTITLADAEELLAEIALEITRVRG